MKHIHLLAIDPQNDFCDLDATRLPYDVNGIASAHPALPVPGSTADMFRLGRFIEGMGEKLSHITVTLDSHPFVAIERPTFWLDDKGEQIDAFTLLGVSDVESGKYVPRFEKELVLQQLKRLEARGEKLMVWPVHCVNGTWGHRIEDNVADAIQQWEFVTGRTAEMVTKGSCPYTEHYGIFVAETPLQNWPDTAFNTTLARNVVDTDVLVVAGEAASHCVRASVLQLISAADNTVISGFDPRKLVLLSDCMSPVTGFDKQYAEFAEYVKSRGARFMTSAEALANL